MTSPLLDRGVAESVAAAARPLVGAKEDLDPTRAVAPLERAATWMRGEPGETYPKGS